MRASPPCRLSFFCCIAISGLLLAGCNRPPIGERSGRLDPYDTTGGETGSLRVLPVALTEFSDQVAQRLAQDLAHIPQIRNAQGRVTVLVGDIENKTGIVSSNDFEFVRSRLRNELLGSRYVTDRIKFVARRARMSRIAERERVADEGYYADPPDYDPSTTFALNGDFYRVRRGDTNQYYMEFQLVHFATNEIVFSDRYDSKQVRR